MPSQSEPSGAPSTLAPVSGPVEGGLTRELRGAFEHAPIGMAIATLTGELRHVNPALSLLLGRPAEAMIGRSLFEVTHEDDLSAARDSCESIQVGTLPLVRLECRLLHASGRVVHVLISTARVPEPPGHPDYLVMHLEDISERKALEAALLDRTLRDPLTGLANRTMLLDRLRMALARGARTGEATSLLFLDLNGFKAVNDAHGHAVGDEVLRELARRISGLLRPSDTAARLGGDEFVVLCEDTSAAGASGVADRLHTATSRPFVLDRATIALTAAVGVASSDGTASDPRQAESMLHAADLRMYESKPRP